MSDGNLVIVTPVYEDEEAVQELCRVLSTVVSDSRIVVVDDGSVTHPLDGRILQSSGMRGAVVRLRRNLGHQGAIAVGLSYVHDSMNDVDYVVVMDSDGEDAPESIIMLLQGFASSAADIRVAERKKRSESVKFIICYNLYKLLFYLLTGKNINFGNFMILKTVALDRLTSMSEIWIHLAASVIASKFRIDVVRIDRGNRYAGAGKLSFVNLVLHGFKAIMIFSEQVLIRIGMASLSVAIASVLVISAAVVLKLVNEASPGWPSTVITAMITIFLQTSVLTLISLMITGLIRISTLNPINYRTFIKQVIEVN